MEHESLLNELLELAWGLIANAGGGDWTKETPEWQEAAARWRERYHAILPALKGPPESWRRGTDA